MANEGKIAGGRVTVTLTHPTLGAIDIGDNMSADAVSVEQAFSWNRQRGHDTGDAARKIRLRGLPVMRAILNTQEMRDDILALIYSFAAPVSGGVEVTEAHANALAPNVGDLRIHPTEMGSDTSLDTVLHNVRCVPDSLTWPFNNEDGTAHYASAIVFECVVEAGETLFEVGTSTDVVAPTVDSVTPLDAASGVAVDAAVQVTFLENMVEDVVEDADNSTILRADTGVEIGSLVRTYNSGTKVLTIAHANFPAATDIIVILNKRMCDLAGNEMAANYIWNFTTV